MAYTRTTFVNGQAPAVSAEEMNKIGQGIVDAHNLAEKATVITGVYTGDNTNARLINLGFKPRAVLVEAKAGTSGDSNNGNRGLILDGYSAFVGQDTPSSIVSNGFTVSGRLNADNSDFNPFRYLAWK